MTSTPQIQMTRFASILLAIGLGTLAVGQDAEKLTNQAPLSKWAQHYYDRIAKFKEENAQRQENAGKPRIVIVGSSHVEGIDAEAMLPRWHVVNRGIGSDRIGIDERGILHRLDSSVFNTAPDVLVLQSGVNDLGELWRHGTPSVEEIDACYRVVVGKIRARLPNVPLVIVGLFPTTGKYAELVPHIVKLDARLKQIATDFDCPFLETYGPLANAKGELRDEYSREGLHLTRAGYEVWAKLLDDALVQVVAGGTVLDPATATSEPESDLRWYDARQLVIEGKAWNDTEKFYERLPARAEPDVTKQVWTLSKRTAGIAVRFATDSKKIAAVWDGGTAMNHMAATGNSGLDLYAKMDGTWVFAGIGRPQPKRTTATLAKSRAGKLTEYLLYLPLYSGVTELKVGVEPDALMVYVQPRPAKRAKTIVFYGTSITQGGCASRAGMCHPAILGRWLDREVVNLGFSGSGQMEPEVAHLLSELDAAVFVLECLPNMTTEMVQQRVQPFVHILRKARPTTPILLVESPLHPSRNAGNAALRDAFEQLIEESVGRLHYLPGAVQLAGREDGTVDGVHPTDLGFFQMATTYEPMLREILKTR